MSPIRIDHARVERPADEKGRSRAEIIAGPQIGAERTDRAPLGRTLFRCLPASRPQLAPRLEPAFRVELPDPTGRGKTLGNLRSPRARVTRRPQPLRIKQLVLEDQTHARTSLSKN